MCANRLGSGRREACDHHFFDLFIFLNGVYVHNFMQQQKKNLGIDQYMFIQH